MRYDQKEYMYDYLLEWLMQRKGRPKGGTFPEPGSEEASEGTANLYVQEYLVLGMRRIHRDRNGQKKNAYTGAGRGMPV